MKYFFYITLLFVTISACGDAKNEKTVVVSESEEEIAITSNKKMTMAIDGMVCKMGCGGAIRKELKATGGISTVEFDFEEERSTNEATIYFDVNKISEKEIIEIVASLNDKQFTVGATKTENYTERHSTQTKTKKQPNQEVKIDAGAERIELPNLIEVLQSMIL